MLANKQARGAFGQMRMETIMRDALPSGAYEFQPTLSNGKRPDCVIRLPNAVPLVVDSKFPLEGFEALRVAHSAEETKLACAAIREAVGRHVAAIEEKYLIPGETQETALMFVPSESVCADLYEKFPDLVQQAHRARVMIVSPNTMMLAVQTVQALLKDAKMRDHADIIQREVGLIIADVAQLVDRVSDPRASLRLVGKIAGEGLRLDGQDPCPPRPPQCARSRRDGRGIFERHGAPRCRDAGKAHAFALTLSFPRCPADRPRGTQDQRRKRKSRDHVGRIVHAEIDARQPDAADKRQHRAENHCPLPRSRHLRRDQGADDAVDAGGVERVPAGKAVARRQIAEERIGPRPRDRELDGIVHDGRRRHDDEQAKGIAPTAEHQ